MDSLLKLNEYDPTEIINNTKKYYTEVAEELDYDDNLEFEEQKVNSDIVTNSVKIISV